MVEETITYLVFYIQNAENHPFSDGIYSRDFFTHMPNTNYRLGIHKIIEITVW